MFIIFSIISGEQASFELSDNDKPEIKKVAARDEGALLNKPLYLIDGSKSITVDPATIEGWLRAQSAVSYVKMFEGDEFFWPSIQKNNTSRFSEYKISVYLSGLAGNLNQKPTNAVLSTSGGKIIVLVSEKDGRELDVLQSAAAIIEALERNEEQVSFVFEVKRAEIRANNLAELGLIEHLSQGYSNFTGSPVNRRHNVKTGAAKFNGALIRPGDTFSFVETLGPVDASTGYLPELVIKENKTVPEYGGGMCQVSSTTFRAALNAGLPILERTPHSYPVQYYKPYGVDATVYIPKPDLVFKNDTGKYILIQTSISGNNLYFDFYGTKKPVTIKFAGNEKGDGAVPIVEKITPMIYDQEVRGRASFTAAFWRFVTDASGKTVSSKFVSKYDSPDKYPH